MHCQGPRGLISSISLWRVVPPLTQTEHFPSAEAPCPNPCRSDSPRPSLGCHAPASCAVVSSVFRSPPPACSLWLPLPRSPRFLDPLPTSVFPHKHPISAEDLFSDPSLHCRSLISWGLCLALTSYHRGHLDTKAIWLPDFCSLRQLGSVTSTSVSIGAQCIKPSDASGFGDHSFPGRF